MADEEDDIGPLENKPGDSKFKQQNLAAWKPVLTCRCVVPFFFIFGLAFIPLGSILLLASNGVKELTLDYTKCGPVNNVSVDGTTFSGENGCALLREERNISFTSKPCSCALDFTLTEDWTDQVFVYYRLTEFYQNHRRYVRSVNNEQLRGSLSSTSECKPFTADGGKAIVPCGMIANSFFNDTFQIQKDNAEVPWSRTAISWKEDRDDKFQNPSPLSDFNKYSKPDYWQSSILNVTSARVNGLGLLSEDLMNWMRTSALPSFRKLYARFPNGLSKGTYSLQIEYNFPVVRGEKNFVLSTTSWMGGKNIFLGVAYIVVGGLSFCCSAFLAVVNARYNKQRLDLSEQH